MRGLGLTAAWLYVALAGGVAQADDAAASGDAAQVQEEIARDSVRTLRSAARSLKRFGSRAKRSGSAPSPAEGAYREWLGEATGRVDALVGRWSAKLEFFHRDFPREALLEDPERLARAATWLGENNRDLQGQAEKLRADLLAGNEGFTSRIPALRLEKTRAVLQTIGE